MKLTTRSRYGLRAMTYIAANSGTSPIPVTEVADALQLSVDYLEQLVRVLKKDHFLESVRGVKGGYQLTRPASEIMVIDLLNTLEGPMWLADCTQTGDCPAGNHNCPPRLLIRRMSKAIYQELKDETLQDMVDLYLAV